MSLNDASLRQVTAANPAASTWLSANAGSGKTRVLTDRVARLLLGGTEPQRILCLTYTKAAASEMQNRLFARLGQWAMLDEADLRRQLQDLGAKGPVSPATLAEARRLFARAIETPGGLKIQTIHSFCAGLLRRFPLEAGVAPGFTEMDDRAAELLRAEIFEGLAAGEDRDAVDALAAIASGDGVDGLLAEICAHAPAFEPPLDAASARQVFGLAADLTEEALAAEVFLGGEAELLAELLPLLEGGKSTDQKAGTVLAALSGDLGPACLEQLESVFLYGPKAKAGAFAAKTDAFPTKDLRDGPCAALLPRLHDLMRRVEAARPRRIALAAALWTAALHRFAGAFLPRYRARKQAAGWLDFDDLILRAAALLSDRGVAQWVLFRLDGGIDHILVDEAQDTSPGQWQVIERLSEEFTAGEGARDRPRTIFVVGDKKQSIYSFQGADLAAFDRMRGHFGARFAALGTAMQDLTLDHSFRSAPAVLRAVDETFADTRGGGLGGAPRHIAFKDRMPGRVDLWPLIPRAEPAEPEDWSAPVDALPETHHNVQLARRIAGWIGTTLAAGTCIPARDGPRPMHEGDILILVQRRSDLFAEIIAACKAAGLAIAGADRLKLGGELAVRDIRAVLSFLATPEDDLSLAAALRSPLFGWTEPQLYALAQPRKGYLWQELRARTDAGALAARAVLDDLRGQADYLRPFELIERLLTRHGGRARLVARLGVEAEDGIDELLTQALAFERTSVPSLTGFLVWLEGGEVEVKRRPEAAGRAIRVMTVHGAKGLEAPVVILPDTIRGDPRAEGAVLRLPGDGPAGTAVWRMTADEAPPALAAARDALKDRQAEERDRLLYVAMTRAECWLVVCGAGDPGRGTGPQWYLQVAEAMDRLPTEAIDTGSFGEIRRHAEGDWPAPAPRAEAPPAPPAAPALPGWMRAFPASPATDRVLSPSDLGGAKALPGDAGLPEAEALAWGTRLHLLLEYLPGWPPADQAELAARLLCRGDEAMDPLHLPGLLAAARGVLAAPGLARFLGPETLAEVELSARLPELGGRQVHGTVDRLHVAADRVTALDWKSNRVVPDRAEAVPEGILRQMGAYRAALRLAFPGRQVEMAVVWTATGTLMPLPCELVDAALRRAGQALAPT
ncbi:double-strand break repair helicase AddA [Frigidibacter oleivorans]|uniref:double-strand break repair helicase AddA n=1 Tax=Frigidibacter oleivorans TaxID=2487129 RepID=UPI000F8E9DD9|nr:double-strand break repair helicase AddA [Frigidibacter oleivorans]